MQTINYISNLKSIFQTLHFKMLLYPPNFNATAIVSTITKINIIYYRYYN